MDPWRIWVILMPGDGGHTSASLLETTFVKLPLPKIGIFCTCLFGSIFPYVLVLSQKTWQKRDSHKWHSWECFHWITGEFLPYLDVLNLSKGFSLDIGKNWTNVKKCVRHTTDMCHMCLGPWPLVSSWNSDLFTCKTLFCSSIWSKVGKNCTKMKKTCRTRDWHVSRVWDHDHWIPGEILTSLHVNYFSVALLEPELGLKPTKKKRGALKKKLRGFQKN